MWESFFTITKESLSEGGSEHIGTTNNGKGVGSGIYLSYSERQHEIDI